jgi:hypothetical protein
MTAASPPNVEAQVRAARELLAQAQAGAMAAPEWSTVAKAGETAVAVHTLDNAIRRLIYAGLTGLGSEDGPAAVVCIMTMLGEHIGRLAAVLPPNLIGPAIEDALNRAVTCAGGVAHISTHVFNDAQQKEALH